MEVSRPRWILTKKATNVIVSPIQWVGIIAGVALALNLLVVWLIEGSVPGAYAVGQVLGIHLVAFVLTALVATLTRVGSIGTLVAIYLLAFAGVQILVVLTDLL